MTETFQILIAKRCKSRKTCEKCWHHKTYWLFKTENNPFITWRTCWHCMEDSEKAAIRLLFDDPNGKSTQPSE
jgi:hypothetical protein